MTARTRVLIVDDEPFVRESVTEILRCEGFETHAVADAASALSFLDAHPVHAVLTDLQLPGDSGLALLQQARRRGVAVPIIVITGVGTVQDAVSAIKSGAFDFVQKPVDPAQLVHLVRRAIEHHGLLAEVRHLRETVDDLRQPRTLVGSSPIMQRVRALIAQVAPTDTTVLITGESGTGKEVAADEIHRSSARRDAGIARINCAALPEEQFESELFGHRRGAFAGAEADRSGRFADAEGGTLVLDEISTLRPAVQAKLLRVLEVGEYSVVGETRTRVADVRIVAITNEDLSMRVKAGEFRADLYYRLHVFPIEMPPLRQHREDIPEIAASMLARVHRGRVSSARTVVGPTLAADALDVLGSYGWPGNVRELRNVLERAVIVAGDGELDAHLFRTILETALPPIAATAPDEFHLRRQLDATERELVLKALTHTEGKKKEAAVLLGIDPRNLGYYLRKHQISDEDVRENLER